MNRSIETPVYPDPPPIVGLNDASDHASLITPEACFGRPVIRKPGDECAFYFGRASEPLYGVVHASAKTGRVRSGVLLCPPFAHESDFAHRMYVEWARTLARTGYWVMRFDYRGHGESDGAFERYVLADYIDDVAAAVEAFERGFGVTCRGLCGLRLGAAVAYLAAERLNRELALILWEPIVSGPRYVDELLRVVMAKDMAAGRPQRRTRAVLRESIARGEEVAVEGHPISKPMHDSLLALDLLQSPPKTAGPTLITQISNAPGSAIRPELEAFRATCVIRGPAEARIVGAPPLWYGSLIAAYDARQRPTNLFDLTISWIYDAGLLRTTAHAPATPPCSPALSNRNNIGESTINIESDGVRLTGTLHLGPSLSERRPVVILLPQGMNRRAGWNRLYINLARRLATEGWRTLRFDGHALGDSAGLLDLTTGTDVFLAVENGMHLRDALAAVDFAVTKLKAPSVILAGVCGGAVTAALLTVSDCRVAGAALLETPLAYSASSITPQPMWRYWRKLKSPAAWARVLTLRADFKHHLRTLARAFARRFFNGRKPQYDDWLIESLGPLAHVKLIKSIERLMMQRIPVLYVLGDTDNAEAYERVGGRLKQRAGADATAFIERNIHGADHDFLEPRHGREIADVFVEWLNGSKRPWAINAKSPYD